MACIATAVPIYLDSISTDYHGVHVRVYIPIHLLKTHNTIPLTGGLTNITTEMLAYGFYCNRAMAHKLAVRYNRSHNANYSHNVISECISLLEILCSYFKQHSFHTTAVQFKQY